MARGYKELREPDADTRPLRDHDSLDQSHATREELNSLSQNLDGKRGEGNNKDDVELEDLLRTNPSTGLTTEQASQRLRTFGPNDLPVVKSNKIFKFLSYFVGPIAFLIELACIISIVVK
ncbi:hypothetical protein BGX21_001095, partial [Mortierella sp. AD011]